MALTYAQIRTLITSSETQQGASDRITGSEVRAVDNALVDKIEEVAGTITPGITVLTASATLDFGNLGPYDAQDLNITVPGAAVGDPVALGIPGGFPSNGSLFFAWVQSVNNVVVRHKNYNDGLEGNINPASGVFKVKVFK